jgi:hypothetical protein
MEQLSLTSTFEKLADQLRDFGLDPVDWKLSHANGHFVQVTHKQDQEFRFVGVIDPSRECWIRLELASL